MISPSRRMLQWAARLYPRAWRARYGEEFTAMIEELPEGRARWGTMADIACGALVMRVRRGVMGMATMGGLAGLGIAAAGMLAIPDHYVTGALVGVAGGVDYGTLTAGVKRSLERAELERLIQKHGLYGGEADAAGRMERDVRVTVVERSKDGSRGIQISYTHPVPETARRVASDITAAVVRGQAGLTLLDAPALPRTPAWPNRSLLLLFGVALGSVTGLGAGLWRRKVLRGSS